MKRKKIAALLCAALFAFGAVGLSAKTAQNVSAAKDSDVMKSLYKEDKPTVRLIPKKSSASVKEGTTAGKLENKFFKKGYINKYFKSNVGHISKSTLYHVGVYQTNPDDTRNFSSVGDNTKIIAKNSDLSRNKYYLRFEIFVRKLPKKKHVKAWISDNGSDGFWSGSIKYLNEHNKYDYFMLDPVIYYLPIKITHSKTMKKTMKVRIMNDTPLYNAKGQKLNKSVHEGEWYKISEKHTYPFRKPGSASFELYKIYGKNEYIPTSNALSEKDYNELKEMDEL